MWRSRSTRSAWCFACSVISAGAAPGARRQRQRRGRTGRGAGDIVGRFGGSLELIVQVLRRFVPDMQDLFAQLERQLGEGDVQGSAATLHTIKGSASTVGASALPAVPASWSRPCAAPIRGAVWKSSPASASTNCAPCAMPACSACRRCSATCRRSRRAEPRCGGLSRQGFRRTRARLHPLRPVGRITPWALSADTEARPGLERHPLPVVQCLQASRSRSWALSRA